MALHDLEPIRYPTQREAAGPAPGTMEATSIWRWLQHLEGIVRPVSLLCVCEAGISRSAAVTGFVYCWRGIPPRGDTKHANLTLLRNLCALADVRFAPTECGLLEPGGRTEYRLG